MNLLEYQLDDVRRAVRRYVDECSHVQEFCGDDAELKWADGCDKRQALRDLVERILEITKLPEPICSQCGCTHASSYELGRRDERIANGLSI